MSESGLKSRIAQYIESLSALEEERLYHNGPRQHTDAREESIIHFTLAGAGQAFVFTQLNFRLPPIGTGLRLTGILNRLESRVLMKI